MHLGRFKKGSTCGSTAVLCVCSDCVDMVLGQGRGSDRPAASDPSEHV